MCDIKNVMHPMLMGYIVAFPSGDVLQVHEHMPKDSPCFALPISSAWKLVKYPTRWRLRCAADCCIT